MPFLTPGRVPTTDDVVAHIEHALNVCGEDHVGIGSDFGAYITPPREMHRLSQVGVLREMLLDEFGDPSLVEDVLANNAIAFLTKHWGPDA